tara:strand:+ start:409 stop:1083 length:675 start_codon:yes stop_codon:yes gene_type:complete
MTKKNNTNKDNSILVIANKIEVLMNQTNDLKYNNDLFFRDTNNIKDTFDLSTLVVSIDMSSLREDGTKDTQKFKDDMKENKLEFLTRRENRTALNGLRRLIYKDVKCEDLQDFDVNDVIAMVKHEKFKKSKMVNFQTVVNNTKKYLIEILEDKNEDIKKDKSSSNGSSSNDENSSVDNFENFYNQLSKVLNDKKTPFDNVLTIQDLVNDIVNKRREDIKISKAS